MIALDDAQPGLPATFPLSGGSRRRHPDCGADVVSSDLTTHAAGSNSHRIAFRHDPAGRHPSTNIPPRECDAKIAESRGARNTELYLSEVFGTQQWRKPLGAW